MTSLGIKLRSQRERLGLTVSDVAIQTKIRESYLVAIENDHLDEIPGGFFSRSFVRQYARALGLKQSEIESDLDAVIAKPEDNIQVERILTDYRPTQITRGGALPGEEEEPFSLHQADFLKDRGTGKRWIAFALLLIAGSVGYLSLRHQPHVVAGMIEQVTQSKEVEWPALPAPVAPKVEIPVLEVSTEAPAQDDSPVPVNAQASAKPTTTVVPEPAASTPVEVAVVATEKAWVRLSADGNRLFGGVLQAGERRTVTGSNRAVVQTGNAGGLEIVYNGKPLGAVGPRGLVRTAVFTPLGYEIRKKTAFGKPGAMQQFGASAQP